MSDDTDYRPTSDLLSHHTVEYLEQKIKNYNNHIGFWLTHKRNLKRGETTVNTYPNELRNVIQVRNGYKALLKKRLANPIKS